MNILHNKHHQDMKSNSFQSNLPIIVTFATVFFAIVTGLYFFNFHGGMSDSPGDWGTFGDYVGGLLNPVLSYLSLIALLITINLQIKELDATRTELTHSRMAQEEQSRNFKKQLDLLEKKDKRDLTFQMLERWTNQQMRTNRLTSWNYLIGKFPDIDKQSDVFINIYQFNKDSETAFEAFSEVTQFFSDLNKLISQEIVDLQLCQILFADSLVPWFIFIDRLTFDRFEEILGRKYNEKVENWYKVRVMGLKDKLGINSNYV
ncbi:MAG: hypothetical protein DI539_20825 [Flavobacterium psychrophilum]|nr:MAG: hypothetical protein DI539_20825 [Flavobacterium psychrophilum]